jgi:hypothetical protein
MSEDQVIDGEEYEEICSEEVDRVVGLLEELAGMVQSQNIREFLEEASANIYYLVYEDEEEDSVSDAA